MNYLLIAINCRFTHSCLSLFYVRNELFKHIKGCKVTLHDFTINDPYFDTLTSLCSRENDALFFSVYIWNADYVLRLIRDIALIKPSLPIILGGPQVSALTKEDIPGQCTLVQGEIEGIPDTFYQDLQQGTLDSIYTCESTHSFEFPYTEEDLTETLTNKNIYYTSSMQSMTEMSLTLGPTKNRGQSTNAKSITINA